VRPLPEPINSRSPSALTGGVVVSPARPLDPSSIVIYF
jgi:hypothetical protein